ncbi:MAG: sugar phosphate isomerase/epimerase [Phycisphaerae bacterium]|nr:sugar phosphate isomerase/epimerase [Phycisphaerae bacterium]
MNPVTLTSSPWGFRLTPLEEQCQFLKSNGIEYICGQFAKFPGTMPVDIAPAKLDETLATVQKHGLSYASVNANGDFMVREDVEKEIALACADIDRAARLKPKVIILFAGWVDRDDDAVYDQVSAALKRVTRHAAKYNLTVGLENHGGLTRTAEQCNRILAGVDEPNIGLNFDPANFWMYDEDPLAAIKKIEFPIVFTHFKSLKRVDGKKEYCRLSEGEIDYPPILQWLADKYEGFYGLEYEEPSDVFEGTRDDLRQLNQWLENI